MAILFYFLAITITFGQSAYSVNENDEPAQAVLALSNPSSTAFTVQVTNTDGSATGIVCGYIDTIVIMLVQPTNLLQEEALIMGRDHML